jgi:hypothetical protein
MPATISRLLMCFGVLMGAVVVYFTTFVFFESRGDDTVALAIAGVCGCGFFAGGWILTWRTTVRWSTNRVVMTLCLLPGCLLVAGMIGVFMGLITRYSSDELGVFVGTLAWVTAWLIGTAIIWRENAKERGERLRQLGIHAVACPDCGYNLTGLREAKCPECGAAYTLDQLYATLTEQRAELGGE